MSAAEQQGITKNNIFSARQQALNSALTRDYSPALPSESDLMTWLTLAQVQKSTKDKRKHLTAGLDLQLLYLDKAGEILHSDEEVEGMTQLDRMELQNLFGTDFRGQVQLADYLKEEAKSLRARQRMQGAAHSLMREENKTGNLMYQLRGAPSAFSKTGSSSLAAAPASAEVDPDKL